MKRVRDDESTLEFAGEFEERPRTDLHEMAYGLFSLLFVIGLATETENRLGPNVAILSIVVAFFVVGITVIDRRSRPHRLTISREKGISFQEGTNDDESTIEVPASEITTLELQFREETATGVLVEFVIHRNANEEDLDDEPEWPEDPSQLIPWSETPTSAPRPAIDERYSSPERRRDKSRHHFPIALSDCSKEDLPAVAAAFARVLPLPIFRRHSDAVFVSSEPSSRPELYEKPMPATTLAPTPEGAVISLDPRGKDPSRWSGSLWTPHGGTILFLLAYSGYAIESLLATDHSFRAGIGVILILKQIEMLTVEWWHRPRFETRSGQLRARRKTLSTPTRLILNPEERSLLIETKEGWLRWRNRKSTLRKVAAAMAARWRLEVREPRPTRGEDTSESSASD